MVLFKSLIILIFLSIIESAVLESLIVIVDLSVSPFLSIFVSFMYFEICH